ncbi:MAG TPA: cytochrome c-type biogenesis CcmF C-terminal domain-containing protein, partial [Polyangia bacterium]|nr:cytochrome c-type biogenesis CcmF C-terminal domain-containing protein [Polyangia bacterium]
LLTWFLVFLGVVGLGSIGLIIYRMPLLRSRSELESWASREFAFVVNNWILLLAAFVVLFWTMFPTISEAVTGHRVAIGPTFFNLWMIPIGLTLLALTGVGPLMAWRRSTVENLKNQFAYPVAAFGSAAILLYLAGVRTEWAALLCWSLCAFVTTSIAQEFWRGTRVRQRMTKLDFFTSLVGLVGRSKRRYGGYLIHIAVVMLFLGWAGNAYKKEAEAALKPGQSLPIASFAVRYDRIALAENLQKEMVDAQVTVLDRGQLVRLHRMPGLDLYKKGGDEGRITMPSITRFLVGDLYLTLAGYDAQANLVNIKAVWNPLVSWYWLGFMMLAFGTAICLAPDRAYGFAAARRGVATAATVGVFLLALLGVARSVHAQMPIGTPQASEGSVQVKTITPAEREVFKYLGCKCPTCNKDPLSDCSCPVADRLRDQVRGMMARGMTKDQILAAYAQEQGADYIVIPRNPALWAVPYGGGLGAVVLLVVLARRWTRRSPRAQATTSASPDAPAAPATPASAYDERLEDELRDLE